MVFYKILWGCPHANNELKEYKKVSISKRVKVMKCMSKTKFNHLLMNITFKLSMTYVVTNDGIILEMRSVKAI